MIFLHLLLSKQVAFIGYLDISRPPVPTVEKEPTLDPKNYVFPTVPKDILYNLSKLTKSQKSQQPSIVALLIGSALTFFVTQCKYVVAYHHALLRYSLPNLLMLHSSAFRLCETVTSATTVTSVSFSLVSDPMCKFPAR